MTALAADFDRPRSGPPVAKGYAPALANAVVKKGSLVVTTSAGFGTVGSVATGLVARGVAIKACDNTGGANGAKSIDYEEGDFPFENHGADLLVQADNGLDCFIVDDNTVAKTNGGATRSRAGKFLGFNAAGKPLVRVGAGF